MRQKKKLPQKGMRHETFLNKKYYVGITSVTWQCLHILVFCVCCTGKPPAAVHAVVAGPQDRRVQGACGASTLRTRQVSKCKYSL